MTYNYGPVPVIYSYEELKGLIDRYIEKANDESSFKEICQHILYTAKENGRVKGAPHAEYISSELCIDCSYKISRILWEKVWNREIYIAFGENPYRAHYNGDTRFMKV